LQTFIRAYKAEKILKLCFLYAVKLIIGLECSIPGIFRVVPLAWTRKHQSNMAVVVLCTTWSRCPYTGSGSCHTPSRRRYCCIS